MTARQCPEDNRSTEYARGGLVGEFAGPALEYPAPYVIPRAVWDLVTDTRRCLVHDEVFTTVCVGCEADRKARPDEKSA